MRPFHNKELELTLHFQVHQRMNSQVHLHPDEPASSAGYREDPPMSMNVEAAEQNVFDVMTIETTENPTRERA